MINTEITKTEALLFSEILINPANAKDAVSRLSDQDFYETKHKVIFSAVASLVTAEKQINIINVYDGVKGNSIMKEDEWRYYLCQVEDLTYNDIYFDEHLDYLSEQSLRRKICVTSKNIEEVIKEDNLDAEKTILTLEKQIVEYKEDLKKYKKDNDGIESVMNEMAQEAFDNGGAINFGYLETQLKELDKKGFIAKGGMTILCARPAMGKTSVAMAITVRLLVAGNRVLLFTNEVDKRKYILKWICQEQNKTMMEVSEHFTDCYADIDPDRFKKMTDNLVIYDNIYNKSEIMSIYSYETSLKKIDVIAVDQVTNLSDDLEKHNLKTYEMQAILKEFEKIAVRDNVAALLLAQLNRKCEERDFPLPNMADVRDSGAFEMKAAFLVTMMRPEVYFEERGHKKGFKEQLKIFTDKYGAAENGENLLLMNCCKVRYGSPGIIPLRFETPGTGITDWKSDSQSITCWNKEEIIV